MSGFPILELPVKTSPPAAAKSGGAETRLRSTQAVNGYNLKASDGIVGHICDFMMDSRTWAIRQLVIKTGNRFSGGEVQVETSAVDRISYDESTVFVHLTKETIEKSAANPLAPVGAAD
jgi:hypothetical protein